MRTWPMTRLAALGGLAAIVCFVVGNVLPGESPPKFDDSPQKIAAYFSDNHKSLLFGAILYGVIAPLFVFVFATLAQLMRSRGQTELAVIAFGGALLMLAIGGVGDGVAAAATQIAANGDADTVKTLYQVDGFIYERLFWVGLALVVPVGLAAWRGALPRWQAWLSALAAALFFLGGISVKASGAFSATGAFGFLGFLGFLVWLVGVSIVLWRAEAPMQVPAAAPSAV